DPRRSESPRSGRRHAPPTAPAGADATREPQATSRGADRSGTPTRDARARGRSRRLRGVLKAGLEGSDVGLAEALPLPRRDDAGKEAAVRPAGDGLPGDSEATGHVLG